MHDNHRASTSVFGHRNAGHGRGGLHDAKGAGDSSMDGYKFYESSMPGDVVIVKNSGAKTVDPANGLNGWNLSWSEWRAGSAVRAGGGRLHGLNSFAGKGLSLL